MTDEQDNAGKAVGKLDANASGGRGVCDSPDPSAAGGVPPAALVTLPPNTCTKWPHRRCGGRCDDKTCCTCETGNGCNSQQTCSNPGQMPHKVHEEGWPLPPDTEPIAPASAPEVLSAQLSTSAPCRTRAETAVVRMVLDAGLPEDVVGVTGTALEELMEGIRRAEQTGHREAIRICCLAAAVRIRFFAKDSLGWLAVMEREFGYDRRFSYTCLTVGHFVLVRLLGLQLGTGEGAVSGFSLGRATVATLLRCDLRKLERIAAIPSEHLTRFIDQHPNLATAGRDTVFEEVTKYLGKLPAATTAQKQDAKKLERKEQLEKDRSQPEWKLDHAAHEIVKLAAKTQMQFGKIDAGHAFRAGFCLQKAAADSLERGESPLSEEDLASIEHNLGKVLEFVRKQRKPQVNQQPSETK